MSPAAHALDRRIYELRSAHQAVAANLADLEAEDTYALLAAGTGLSGDTAEAVGPAVRRVAELRPCVEPIAHLLTRATAARNAEGLDDRRAAELVAWLNSPTIAVPTDPRAEPMPAQALLTDLDDAVRSMRELVAEVDAAWQEFLPRLERATTEAARLAADLPGNRAVAAVRRDLTDLSSRVVEDPLGATGGLGDVESALEAAAGAREEAAGLRDRLAAAAELADELDTRIAAGHAGLVRSRAEVFEAQGLLAPLDAEVMSGERGLRPWLERLERLVAEGDVGLAEKGLDGWQSVADQTLAAAEQVAEANLRPTARRQELVGLLRAARVKAGAAGRAEDPWATELADRAERALAVPCRLPVAEAELDAYLEELRRPVPAPVRPARSAGGRVPGGSQEMSA